MTGTPIRMMEEKGKGTRKNIRVSREGNDSSGGDTKKIMTRVIKEGSGKDKGRTGEGQREG